MRIRTYFVNSFVVHAVFLIYLFSLPLHRTIIQPGPYNAYFVSLQSEGKKTANRSSARGTKKPEVHGEVKFRETRSKTKEPVISKENERPEEVKEATPVEKLDDRAREQAEEQPVAEVKAPDEFQQVTQAQQEVPALEEKKQETQKNAVPESKKNETKLAVKEAASMPPPPDISKVDEKRLEPEKREALKEKAVPVEAQETAKPQEIEKPLKEIPEGEKPDVKETQRIEPEKKPSTEEEMSSPEIKKAIGFQESETVSKAESPLEHNKLVPAISGRALSGTRTKGKPKTSGRKKPQDSADKKLVSSKKGLKGGAAHSKVGNSTSGQLSSQEGSSSLEGNSPVHGEGEKQPVADVNSELKEKSSTEINQPGMGIPVSEALIPVDLKIEVFLRKPSSLHPELQTQKVPVSPTTKQNNMPKATEITQVSLETSGDEIKVRVKGNGLVTPKVFPYQNRIVIDIPRVVINAKLPSEVVSPLKEIRSGKHKDKSRLVLDLNEKMPFDVSPTGDTVIITVHRNENKPYPPPLEQEVQEKIETEELKETDISGISMHLLRNPHPTANRREKQVEVALLEGKKEAHSGDTSTVKRAFSVLRTTEGAYTFILKNEESAPYETDLAFLIFQGRPGERTKKFAAIKLSPHTTVRFKFLLPEAIFWDDEDYFSGKIENSDTVTKFSGKTGLVWKETKDE
jgi:hypothetical protein